MAVAPRPRLLMVLNDAPFFLTHRLPVARAARDAGFDVHVAVPVEDEPVAVMEQEGFIVHDIPLRRGARKLGGELALILRLRQIVRAVEPDMMHAVTMKPVLYGGLVARLSGVPAVVHAITGLGYLFVTHSLAARVQRTIVKLLYRFALGHRNACAIFQNPDDLALFSRENLVDPRITLMIKGCGVDMQHFVPQPEPAGPVTVMFPARILKARGSDARFVLVGRTDPDNPTDVGEAGIRAWEREGLVEWQGFSRDMAATLSQAHVICMPSYREGLPRVLIEAIACGRPVVTADVPGCREVVRDGENGFLVPVRNGHATAEAIEQLVANPALRRHMGERARAIAEDEFSVTHFVTLSLEAYRRVLPARRWPRPAVDPTPA